MLLHQPFPMLSSRKSSGPLVRQGAARAASVTRCCALPNDKPKNKASIPTSLVNNYYITGGEVHIHMCDGKGQAAEWDAVAMSPEAKALLQRHAVKASTALKMHDVLGFEDVGDLQHLSSDLIAQLELKPLQLEPLVHMLRDLQKQQQDNLLIVGMQGQQQQQQPHQQPQQQPDQQDGSRMRKQDGSLAAPAQGTDGPNRQEGNLRKHACVMKMKAGAEGAVKCVAITPDGRRAVTAGSELHVWDLEARSCIAALEGHTTDVETVVITPDGRRAASCSKDRTLRVWDLDTYACTASLDTEHDWLQPMAMMAITPDGRHVLYGHGAKLFRWAMDDSAAAACGLNASEQISFVAVTPDGRLAVVGGSEGKLFVWDLDEGVRVGTLGGHTDYVTCVAITPDGRHVVSASTAGYWEEKETMLVWELATRSCIGTMRGHVNDISCVAISPDGRRAVSGSRDRTLCVWDLASRTCTGIMEGHGDVVNCVAITPDGRYAVSGSNSGVQMWDLGPSTAHSKVPGSSSL